MYLLVKGRSVFSSAILALSVSSVILKQTASLTTMSSVSLANLQWHINFDNRNLRSLPVDDIKENYVRQVPNAIFSFVNPTPVKEPKTVAYSASALELLGVSSDEMSEESIAQYLSGNVLLEGSQPAAHCYCGHQFGSFAGQLGDGAAISLGEVVNPVTSERWELQLKGAGKTPYSRGADGRKVLRSSIREFLCSEAMHFLGVPTTRAGAVVVSSSAVERDPFYSGHSVLEPCAVVARISPHFFRFGSLEVFKERDPKDGDYGRAGPSARNTALKTQLLQHLLTFSSDASGEFEERLARFFQDVVESTARLVAQWQAVGFVHGVLNTDNMSLRGLTIDYGPFGFL
eukprot:gene34340-41568_t